MNRLKSLREERGMKQAELGKLLNVKYAAISKYESGKIPLTGDTLIELSKIFGVTIDYLLGNSDNSEEQSEPEYTTASERQLLNVYRDYTDNGFSQSVEDALTHFFPELKEKLVILSHSEKKMLSTFKNLNEDNQDIIVGETKKSLKEQRINESVAADEMKLTK